jgi:hypothetical protein
VPTIHLKPAELTKALLLETGEKHKIIVHVATADVVNMEDVNFHHNSSVVLPWRHGENAETTAEQQRLSGLSVIIAALRFAKKQPDQKLLLAGHTDSSGKPDYNRKLSRVRAQATLALLKGDRDDWAAACVQYAKVEDLQQVLTWVSEVHGWRCHPGKVDNAEGNKTRKARRTFRKRYNDEFSKKLSLDGPTSANDWKAFYDLYDLSLTDVLGAELEACRSALNLHEPSVMACGEDFAEGASSAAGIRSAANRRVELLFLDPAEPYPDFFKESPPGLSIYGDPPLVVRRYLPVEPPVHLSRELKSIEGLYKPGHVDPADKDPKASGYEEGYLSEDDHGRIFVNHVPRTDPSSVWDGARAKDTQFIELCARVQAVQGTVPPEARVEWEWFDPNAEDHPETHEHQARLPDDVDTDGKARDRRNRGCCDYPSPSSTDMARFAQAGDFGFADGPSANVCDTAVKEGESRVRLHVSNVAGDSFVAVARIKNVPRIAPSGEQRTGVMTVWKRVDVEYVRTADALALPIARVAPFFEPARVQMDFAAERQTAAKPFLTKNDRNEEAACADYASRAKGEFTAEGKPGWFFLAAAERASSEFFTTTHAARPSHVAYEGKATVAVVNGGIEKWEKVIVDQVIKGKVSLLLVRDHAGGPHGYMGVWKKDILGGKTHLHLAGLDYASDFEVPHGRDTGLLGGPGKGGAYDKMDFYYLRHRTRQPSGRWEAGGLGFGAQVVIEARPPGSVETSGLSPTVKRGGREYFSGRLIIFTRAFGAQTLDENDAIATIVHEFTHAFGFPHKCGYYSWQMPAKDSCSMNYFSTWLYASGTRNIQRFVYGDSGAHLCARHLAGVREVHLEDNPAIWKW